MQVDDVSPTMHDPKTQVPADLEARAGLERHFAAAPGSVTEKLENFSKFVPRQSLARFLARYEIFRLIKEVQGSIVECGVLFGGGLMSFAKLSAILEPYNFQRRVVGFDSFTGFPRIAQEDLKGLPERKSAHLREHGFSATSAYEDLLQSVELFDSNRFLSHFPKVSIVKGDFAETGPKFLEDHPHLIVSCLYLDFDIYEPTKLALDLFLPRMPRGAVLVFDELNDEGFPGETLAVLKSCNLRSLRVRRFDFEPRISFAVMGE